MKKISRLSLCQSMICSFGAYRFHTQALVNLANSSSGSPARSLTFSSPECSVSATGNIPPSAFRFLRHAKQNCAPQILCSRYYRGLTDLASIWLQKPTRLPRKQTNIQWRGHRDADRRQRQRFGDPGYTGQHGHRRKTDWVFPNTKFRAQHLSNHPDPSAVGGLRY